jgi:hypothetical protein
MAARPNMLKVAELRELTDGGAFTDELQHGEMVQLERPKARFGRACRQQGFRLTSSPRLTRVNTPDTRKWAGQSPYENRWKTPQARDSVAAEGIIQ